MPDNGYGAKANSGDFLLRLYKIRPEFKTAAGGTGTVAVGTGIFHVPEAEAGADGSCCIDNVATGEGSHAQSLTASRTMAMGQEPQ